MKSNDKRVIALKKYWSVIDKIAIFYLEYTDPSRQFGYIAYQFITGL